MTYAIAVLGMVVVLGYTGQINLAQAAFFGIGAYAVGLGTLTLQLELLGLAAAGHRRGAALPASCWGSPRCGWAATTWR